MATEFTITRLPDDPRLSPERAARRNRKNGKLATKGPARSVTKPHQHHLIALKEATS